MENSLNQNKVWGWGELALMYFPNISQKSATMQLLKWIRVSDELVGQLEKSGWHPGKKYLTPRQKDYIVGHLGEPWRGESWKVKVESDGEEFDGRKVLWFCDPYR